MFRLFTFLHIFATMINQLSILIPVYNDVPEPLVAELHRQAEAIEGLEYEILVFDDGSDNEDAIRRNMAVCALPFCRYVRGGRHVCRAAMRNDMARHGRYDWHLMVDARLSIVYKDFIRRYLDSGARPGEAVCGGVCVDGGSDTKRLYSENLRFRYEKHEEKRHSFEARKMQPYSSFRTTNFFYHRTVLERVPYDERIKTYGYEDVMLGKAFKEAGIRVLHIDNPVAYMSFESNTAYLKKLDQALLTLHRFAPELQGFSPLLEIMSTLRRCRLLWLVRLFHVFFGKALHHSLEGRHPSLFLLRLYKLGFFAGLG